jgi:hypothetical protein
VTGKGLDKWASIIDRGRDFSLHHYVKSSSGVHPAFFPMGIDQPLSMGLKCLSVMLRSKICGVYLYAPYTSMSGD